ncbi:hypothetical protein RJ641_026553 [Dillenia turbinata]|uniref:Uncharacterized protein n=1 Tax=Dillenia turbinata TaxID=194707 RepID=A0AAN8ZKG3_9MAGN
MARLLSQSLIKLTTTTKPSQITKLPPFAPSSRLLTHRTQSSFPGDKGQIIEIDLETSTATSPSLDGGEVEVLGIRKLEEFIYGVMVKRSAPDWLPFIPGSSYWVPPRPHPYNLAELLGKMVSASKPLSEEQALSFTTARGWPSASYFLEGGASQLPVELELQFDVQVDSEDASHSKDDGK